MIRLALSNLRHHWRTNLGVLLGTLCATAVLVGAMVVGDSVRLSLREQALHRIGKVDAALIAGDRHFRATLADKLATELGGVTAAPVLSMPGIARSQEQETKAGIVDVFGVDDRFFALSPRQSVPAPEPDKAHLSTRLASQLGVQPGDSMLLRIEKPSLLPRDMLMASIDDVSFALRLEVAAILDDDAFGRFGMRASQVPPFNVFVSLRWLQQKLDLADRANLMLLGGDGTDPAALAKSADAALAKHWTLDDMELRTRSIGAIDEVTSRRIFLDRPIVAEIEKLAPDALGVLTYFVNSIRHGKSVTPYSTIAGLGPLTGRGTAAALAKTRALAPADRGSEQVVISDWLAKDLGIAAGGTLEVEYFTMGEQLRLTTKKHTLKVARVVPLAGAAADKDLMPEFPGLADSENCRDWEPGIPVDLERIREKDETYWDEHRGTPKAFVGLAKARGLWSNRYGSLTAIRGPKGLVERLAKDLPQALSPRTLGLFFHDLRGPALAAGTSATDFGGLFLGLSFFLIGAALLLTALLFGFGVGQRANEIGTLLAVGWRPRRVRRLFLLESLVLAIVGGGLGAIAGLGYTRAVLYGLGTLWRDAVGTTTLSFHAPPATLAMGTAISILVAVGTIALTLRKVFDTPAVELLQSQNGIPAQSRDAAAGATSKWLSIVCPVLGVGLLFGAGALDAQAAAGAFFGAGALLLIGGLALCRRVLVRFAGSALVESISTLAQRNTGRRIGRSLATVALLASGTFLVVAVQANRLEPPQDVTVRSSGTGGFALFGRSTLPILRDLASPEGREEFGLTDDDLQDVRFVPMRIRDGDDASCLNLSLAQNPRLLGVDPKELVERGAFSFGSVLDATEASPWALLDKDYGADVVPAIGDAASIMWALHKSVGDDLEYVDDQGRAFKVRIVGAVTNSILQGNLVIAERHMRARFPSATGYRMFLVDVPPARMDAVATTLTNTFEDIGLELTPTAQRLADFNAVQNTYLLIFQALGGLGLLLGSIGVGMVVLRNALERRSELALLAAVGFRRRVIRRLIWREHTLLLLLGLGVGTVTALLAVVPAARDLSVTPIAVVVAAVGISGALWVFVATRFATRGDVLRALRAE